MRARSALSTKGSASHGGCINVCQCLQIVEVNPYWILEGVIGKWSSYTITYTPGHIVAMPTLIT